MKIIERNPELLQLVLDWNDIESLKAGNLVAERYNGEHKFNILCLPETLLNPNWTEEGVAKPKTEFNEYLHDFFLQLSVYDIRNSFIHSTTISLCKNPYFEKVKVIYPT